MITISVHSYANRLKLESKYVWFNVLWLLKSFKANLYRGKVYHYCISESISWESNLLKTLICKLCRWSKAVFSFLGFPCLGVLIQKLENPSLRAYLKVQSNEVCLGFKFSGVEKVSFHTINLVMLYMKIICLNTADARMAPLTTCVCPSCLHTIFDITSTLVNCNVLINIIFYCYIILLAHRICWAFFLSVLILKVLRLPLFYFLCGVTIGFLMHTW